MRPSTLPSVDGPSRSANLLGSDPSFPLLSKTIRGRALEPSLFIEPRVFLAHSLARCRARILASSLGVACIIPPVPPPPDEYFFPMGVECLAPFVLLPTAASLAPPSLAGCNIARTPVEEDLNFFLAGGDIRSSFW